MDSFVDVWLFSLLLSILELTSIFKIIISNMQSSLAFITRITAKSMGINKISHKLTDNPRIINVPNTTIQGSKGTPNSSAFLKQPL
ncbi:MAG: hypothetical protein RI956_856 [Pseudomonadota bacterium]